MRTFAAALVALVLGAPALAQAPGAGAQPCTPREGLLGGIGRATVVSFRGPVFGGDVCAVVANLAGDAFTVRVADTPAGDALVAAALTDGGDVTVPMDGATLTKAGPYVVAPGGAFPAFGGDTAEAPRVVLAYAGGRVLLIATTPVALVDLARILRAQPALFGTDAVERAIVIASGPAAAMEVRTSDGPIGVRPAAAPRVLSLMKRG